MVMIVAYKILDIGTPSIAAHRCNCAIPGPVAPHLTTPGLRPHRHTQFRGGHQSIEENTGVTT